MDVDFWASKGHSTKHFSAHLSSENDAVLVDLDVNDDVGTYFTCPFCYVDTELCMLCHHLQEEHCFDARDAVCPVCALNLGKDLVGHFKVHHSSSIKTRRRSRKSSGFWSFYSGRSPLGDLSSKSGAENMNGSSPDPLLSPFLCSISYYETKGDRTQDSCCTDDISPIPVSESSKSSVLSQSSEEQIRDSEELRQRANFCQQLFLSAMF